MKRVWVCAGIVAAVVAGASGCSAGEEQRHREVSYGVPGQVRTLVIEGRIGDVSVTGTAGPDVRVTEHQSYRGQEPAVEHSLVNGTLTLRYDCPDGGCGVGYDVHVPAATVVKVSDRTGGIRLTGLSGDVTADTGTGDVLVVVPAGMPYAVDAHSDVGLVSVTVPQLGAAHGLHARTRTGSVMVTSA